MAEKSTKLQSKGDYQLDDSLDIPDFNFDFDEPKADNNPVLSTLKEIGKGALGSIFNKGLVRSTIKNSLPEAYGTAYDFYDQAKESVKSLYNDAARELKPAEGQIKALTRRYLPKTEGILPNKIGEKLKEWSAPNGQRTLSTDQLRNDTTAAQLGQIFQAQAQDTDRRDESSQRREHLNQGIEQIRHRDMLSGLTAIDMGVSRLAAYQDNVLANYQKKSLELQFRQYFVTADILVEVKKKAQTDRYQLEAIVKNTSLSDYAKLKTSDALKQATRNKFMELGSKTLFGGEGEGASFIKKFIENIKGSLKEKVMGGVEGVRGAADSLDMINSVGDSVGDIPGAPGKTQIAGGIAGGFLGSGILGKAQKWLRGKTEADPRINNVADRVQYGVNNFAQIATDRINDPSKPLPFGADKIPGLRGLLQDNLPSNRPDTGLETNGLMAQNQPAIYSNAAQKSLVEVIPGLLARIQRELVITRTGKDSDLITYDYKSNKFSTVKKVGQGVLDSIASQGNKKDIDERLEAIIKSIDPNDTFHPDDKKAIKDKLANISVNRGSADPKMLVNPGTFNGAKDPTAVAKAFQDHFGSDEDGNIDTKNNTSVRNRRVIADQIARLSKYFNDPRAQIQEMARLGQTESLEASGLYDRKENRLDLNKIASSLRGTDLNGGIPTDDTLAPYEEDAGGIATATRRRVKTPSARQVRQPVNNTANLRPIVQAPVAAPVVAPQAAPAPAVSALMPSVKVDNTDIVKILEAQTTAIEKLDSRDLFQKMLEELVKVNTNLEGGINTYSLAEDLVGPQARQNLKGRLGNLRDRVTGAFGRARSAVTDPANIQAAKDKAQELKDKATEAAKAASDKARDLLGRGKQRASKSLADMTLGDLASGASSLIGGVAGRALSGAKLAANIGGGLLRQGATIGGGLLAVGSQKAADFFGDVYLPNESKPRLTRGNMKAGLYFDKVTGKLITSFKDITGPVVDKDGATLLDEDEIKVAYVKGKRTQALKDAVKEAGGALKGFAAVAAGALGGAYGLGLRAAIAGFKLARAALPPYDVYVKSDMKTPKLRKQGFQDRLYISKNTGKRLTHPREVDGVILDEAGNQLVSADDYQVGLVDVKGVTIKGPGRLLGKVGGLVKGAVGFLKGVAGNAKEFLVGIGQAVKDIFGGVFGLKGEYLETSMKQLDVQQAILKVLTDRLPPAKKKVLGDENGDGIREGSGDEQLKAEEAAEAAKREGKAVDPNAEANNVEGKGGLFSKLKGLFGKKKKDGEEEDKGDGTNVNIDGPGGKALSAEEKAAAKAAKLEAKAARAVPKTLLGRVGSIAKAGGRGLLGVGKFAGRAALGLAGLEGLGIGSAVAGAGSAIAGAAGAVGTGALAVGGAALEGAAAVAAGAGALISAPVVLAALGIAAVGVGLYYGYKYLSRTRLDTLSRVRYAQYGFPASDTDHFNKVMELEEKLEDHVKIDGKNASFDDKVDVKDLCGIFGIKPDLSMMDKVFGPSDQKDYKFGSWLKWFNNRFKPVYLANQAVLRQVKEGVKLSDVDTKLSAKEQQDFLTKLTISASVYDEMTAPFPDMDQLTVGADGVAGAISVAQSDITEKVKKEGAPKPKGAPETNAVTTLAKGAKTATGAAAAAGVAGSALSPEKAKDLSKNLSGEVPTVPTSTDGTTLSAKSSLPADSIYTGQNGRLDALTSVRMKTYGLVDMDVGKVKQLRLLEVQVSKKLTINKEGAAYEEDIEDLLDRVKASFGITGAHSERGVEWVKWFRNRFLPVYLNYATMVGKVTNKKTASIDDSTLTPQQQLDVANAITTTSAIVEGNRVSVWKIDNSPWDNYAVNLDDNTIKGNLQFMTEAIKAVKLNEQMSKNVVDASKKAVKDGKAVPLIAPAGAEGAAAGKKNPNEATTADQIKAKNIVAANGYVQANEQRADGQGTRAAGDFKAGTPVEHPGKGTGGDINALPVPTADGYEGMKDLLAAVSKMTGMPLSPLITTAAVESDFKASAMPAIGADGRRASGAVGLFQFIPSTWNSMLQNYGAKYGIAPGTPATDPRANALMGAEFLKENLNALQKSQKGKSVSDTDLYLAHFLGAGGAAQFLSGNPSDIAATGPGMGPGPKGQPGPAASNPTIFYDKRRNGAPRTYGEIYQLFSDKINKKKSQFNLGNDTSVSLPKADPAKDASTPTTSGGAGGAGGTSTTPLPAGQTGPSAPSTTPTPSKAGAAALVASSTPAGTAAGSSSSSGYGGSIARTSGAQTPAPTQPVVVTPSAPAAPTVMRSAPNYAGFNSNLTPSASELGAQSTATNAAMGGDIKTISQTLMDSLKIQTSSRDLLQAIANTLGKQGTGSSATPASTPGPTTGGTPPPEPTRPAKVAPISMARGN